MSSEERIIIIGAGISGLTCAIKLKHRLNCNSVTIFEEASELGGTWRDNKYPGCSSDTPMHFYSLSSDLKPDWESTHGSQESILKYWILLAKKHDLYRRIVFNVRILEASWDPKKQHYAVRARNTSTGTQISMTANILVCTMGALQSLNYPDVDGLQSFKGPLFHSAKWRDDVNLDAKSVAVIGNAASSIQLVPEIARKPGIKITQFCRTPNWILPPIQSDFSAVWQWMFRHIPFIMRLYRVKLFFDAELRYLVFTSRIVRWGAMKMSRWYILASTPPRYHDKLIPHYPMGCKRVLFDNGYLATMHRPNVELNWDEIAEVTEDTIITKKSEKIPTDVIILATGFNSNYFPIEIRGKGGQTVQEYYDTHGAPRAYLGSFLPGFPNLYIIGGPNSFAGHTSILYGAELTIDLCISLMQPILDGGAATVEVTPAATDAYNERIQSMMTRSIFLHCHSWYRKGGNGANSTIFPGGQILRWWWLRKPNWGHFVVRYSDDRSWSPESSVGLLPLTLILLSSIYVALVLRIST